MQAMSHTFEIIFADDVRHRRRQLHCRLGLKEGMIAFLIGAAIVGIIVIVVMKKCRLPRTGQEGYFLCSGGSGFAPLEPLETKSGAN